MSRYKKSEYRAEKRDAEKPFQQQQERCEGYRGMCKTKAVIPCSRCWKPYCAEHLADHQSLCRGMR